MSTSTTANPNIMEFIASLLFEQQIRDFSIFDNFDYCVALDIGGGNSSAAAKNLREPPDNPPKLLKLSAKGYTSLWSNIGYDALPGEEGSITIGRKASNRTYQYSNYKAVPTNQALEESVMPDNYPRTGDWETDSRFTRQVEELTRDYIRTLFENMLAHGENAALRSTPREKILIIVGHPSSDEWRNPEAHDNLVRIVREATGVSTVLTTSESNSAILYALENRSQLGLADKLLIVDLGAYSADYTFIDRKNLQWSMASIPLGGKAIDQNIATLILNNSGVNPAVISPGYSLLHEARVIKENHWPTAEGDADVSLRVTTPAKELTVTITQEDFRSAVAEMPIAIFDDLSGDDLEDSYTGHLTRFLSDAKNELGIGQVDWVIVTGGAARMTPAMEVIRSVAAKLWNVEESHVWPDVIRDQLIDESVPFGSLYFYIKAQEVLREIPAVREKLVDACENMISPMAGKISDTLTDYLMSNIFEPTLLEFRDAKTNISCAKLIDVIQYEFQKKVHQDKMLQLSTGAAKEAADEEKGKFHAIITNFLNSLYGRNADDAFWGWDAVIQPNVDFTDILIKAIQDALSDSLLAEIASWSVLVIMIIWIEVTIALGVIFLLVDGVSEWFIDTFYTDEQKKNRLLKQQDKEMKREQKRKQKEQEEYEKPRNRRDRKKIYKAITSDETRQKMHATISTEIRKALQAEFEKDAFGVPDSYLQALAESIRKAVYTGL